MQYLGGKTRIAKKLAAAIREVVGPERDVWDAFCGGLSMAVALGGRVLASDACAPLVALYRAVWDGWDPPEALSEEEYAIAKTLPDEDPRKAFAGFGCSFGGKWFGGFARAKDKKDPRSIKGYAPAARNGLLRDIPALKARGCLVRRLNFLDVEPRPTTTALYLDPPYAGTTAYGAIGGFDVNRFRERVAAWSRHTDVFVSEYEFPWGRVIWEGQAATSLSGGTSGKAMEKLYRFGPDRMLDQVMM